MEEIIYMKRVKLIKILMLGGDWNKKALLSLHVKSFFMEDYELNIESTCLSSNI